MVEVRKSDQEMARDRNADTGQFVPSWPLDRFEEAIRAHGGAASTTEVAKHVECVYTTAYSKLRELEDEGRITSRKVANARLWMVSEQEEADS